MYIDNLSSVEQSTAITLNILFLSSDEVRFRFKLRSVPDYLSLRFPISLSHLLYLIAPPTPARDIYRYKFQKLKGMMKVFRLGIVICFSQLRQFCHAKLNIKDCFHMTSAPASLNFPCDPNAEVSTGVHLTLNWFVKVNIFQVSTCCGTGSTCVSSLYCIAHDGVKRIGSCTDRLFNDNACPFPLIGLTLFSVDFISFKS